MLGYYLRGPIKIKILGGKEYKMGLFDQGYNRLWLFLLILKGFFLLELENNVSKFCFNDKRLFATFKFF